MRRRLARAPGLRFSRREATWAPALVDEVAATAATTRSTQGPVRLRDRESGGTGCAVRPRARRVPRRVPGGPARLARDAQRLAITSRRVVRLADPQRRGHHARHWPACERQAVADRKPARLLEVYALRASGGDVRRRHRRARVAAARSAARGVVLRRRTQRCRAGAYIEDDPRRAASLEPAGALSRGDQLPLGGVEAHRALPWQIARSAHSNPGAVRTSATAVGRTRRGRCRSI